MKRTLFDLALIALAAVGGAVTLWLVTVALDAISTALGTSPVGRLLQGTALFVLSVACLLSWAVVAMTIVLKRIRDTEATITDTLKMLVPIVNLIALLRLLLTTSPSRRRRLKRTPRLL
jgi:hypothetical protein